MYENYFWDADGTIFNNLELYVTAVGEGLKKYGKPHAVESITPQEIARTLGNWSLQFERARVDCDSMEDCKNDIYDIINNSTDKTVLFEGAEFALQALVKNGKEIIIASNCRKKTLEANIATTNIGEYITDIVSADDVKFPKPSAEMLYAGMAILGNVAVNSCVMIGDSYNDMHAAQHAGMDSIMLIHAENSAIYGDGWVAQNIPLLPPSARMSRGYRSVLASLQ